MKLKVLKDKFSVWRESNICDKKRRVVFNNNSNEILGKKLLNYEFTDKEVIEIFGNPDSILHFEKYYEYMYYTDVICYRESFFEVVCYKDMIFNKKDKLIEIGGMCY